MNSREIALLAATAASDKKAEEIVVVDVAELLVIVEYFVICTGRNDRQVRTIADEMEDQLRIEAKIKPIGREGTDEGKWVLIDFGDVVAHVFQPEEREFYRLEKLWSEAPRVPLPVEVTGPVAKAEEPAAEDVSEDGPVEDAE